MKILKRIFCGLITFFLICNLFSFNLTAIVNSTGKFEYSVAADNCAAIVKYNGDEKELVIPGEIDGYTVKYIKSRAFFGCESLERVVIPSTVKVIETLAFVNCSSLESIIIETDDRKAKPLQIDDFPTLPYEISVQGNSYTLKNELSSLKKIDNIKQLYVDSEKGNDTNDGLTAETAYKTLGKALNTYKFGTVACCINIVNDAVFYSEDLAGEIAVKKDLAIRALGAPAKIISGPGNLSWNISDGLYNADISSHKICGCVDVNDENEADDGLLEPMVKCKALAECKATQNGYFIDGNTVYVNPKVGHSISGIVPIESTYKFRFNHSTSTVSNYLYLENLNIIGNYYNSARSSAYPQADKTFELLAVDCIYQHNFLGDAVPHGNYDIVYEVNCKAGFSKADLFNTHSTVSSENAQNTVLVFLNCFGREAGFYGTGTGINNIFTAHDGENVLRINCTGQNADGPLFADVNGCRSVLINCSSFNDGYQGVASAGSWQFNNVNAVKDGFVTLINCDVVDSRGNPRITSECDIEYSGTDIFTNCNISGSINTIENGIVIENYAFGYFEENGIMQRNEVLTVYGKSGTGAERYADKNGFSFVNIIFGDADNNGVINANDYAVIKGYVNCSCTLSEVQRVFADLNRDGAVDAMDAIMLDLYLNELF